jgi:hypothetical protein
VRESANGGGGCNTKRADMFAPLSSTPTARMIRNHELLHAKITPRVDAAAEAAKAGISQEAIQWSEDYRVGLAQYRRDLVDVEALDEAECAAMAKNICHDRRLVAGAMLALLPLPEQRIRLETALALAGWEPDAIGTIRDTLREITGVAYGPYKGRRAAMRWKPTGFRKITLPLAQYFEHEFPSAPPPGDRRDGKAA